MSSVQGYESLLRQHDWYYGRSDDPTRHREGQSSISRLHLIRAQLDPTGAIWNSIAPDEFKVVAQEQAVERDPRDAEIAALRRALGEQAGKAERLLESIRAVLARPDIGIEPRRLLSNALELEKTIDDIKQRKRT